jgi:hypothetical protein
VRTVGSVATTTAGFRDQFYGFLPHLRAARPQRAARLVTTAMIDPARCHWGRREVRIARAAWTEPWLDLDALASDERLMRWTERLAVPKVLVATQTRVVEACIDRDGDLVPMTPVIAVVPTAAVGIEHLQAALSAPAATAWSLRRFGGAGMSSTALKLAARQVAEIPLPAHDGPWDEAVDLLRADVPDWPAVGRALNAAWGIEDDPLVDWWLNRFPRPGRGSLH